MNRLKPMEIKKVLELKDAKKSLRQIRDETGFSKTTVCDTLKRCKQANVTAASITDENSREILQMLYPKLLKEKAPQKTEPNWQEIHDRLETTNHNRSTLWDEYIGHHPDGYSYAQFCARYAEWNGLVADLSMVQNHEPGDTACVDWAGDTVACVQNFFEGGKPLVAHFFVGVLSCSMYAHVEAFPDEKQHSWSLAHVHMYNRFGGVPRVTVPDNAKTAVIRANLWNPELNPAYRELGDHYNTRIVPARIYHPKDKAAVEGSVRWYSTWIIQKVADRVANLGLFNDFPDLNRYVTDKLDDLMIKGFQKRPGSRLAVFSQIEKPTLLPLPDAPFDSLAHFVDVRVPNNYHVGYQSHYYSVPHTLFRKKVDMVVGLETLKVFDKNGALVAFHRITDSLTERYVTVEEHMPKSHQAQKRYMQQDGAYYRAQAEKVGPGCSRMIDGLLTSGKFEETAYKSCQGILSSAKNPKIGPERVEQACAKCVELGAIRYFSFKSIISKKLETVPVEQSEEEETQESHKNLRDPKEFK